MNIMLLTDIPPCKNFTAGIVLNILCDMLLDAGHSVCCFVVRSPRVDSVIPPDKLRRMDFKTVRKPMEKWGVYGGAISFIGNGFCAAAVLPRIRGAAAEFAARHKADIIWSAVQGQTMIKLTEPVAKAAGVPYVVQVWDPPEWWLFENKFDKFSAASVMDSFGKTLAASHCLLAASPAMAEFYAKKYGCSAVPLVLGFEPGKPTATIAKDSGFIIALSGQMYAVEELRAFIAALNEMGWAHNGVRIVLRLYGRYFSIEDHANIEMRGWLEQEELLGELAAADLLYCPYWFSKTFELPAKLSFPSKLSTYLKVGVPVLFHGPAYSSPYQFLRQCGGAYLCETLDSSQIARQLGHIIDDPDKDGIASEGYAAFIKSLTRAAMKEYFFSGLQI